MEVVRDKGENSFRSVCNDGDSSRVINIGRKGSMRMIGETSVRGEKKLRPLVRYLGSGLAERALSK